MYKEEEKAHQALNRALDLGITYVDTAYAYGDGVSETWVGGVMKQRRKGVFLVTKVQVRDGKFVGEKGRGPIDWRRSRVSSHLARSKSRSCTSSMMRSPRPSALVSLLPASAPATT